MPTTYNGIGTHYYGKRNQVARFGTCPHCRRPGNLVSYDTRLWFVILFVPIVPLGRKRIIDMCPSCRRHYVAEWQKWETGKQLDISGALEKFRSDPTPENAIEAHRLMLVYRQTNEAEDFSKLMGEKFSDNARVLTYLGSALTEFGQPAKAAAFFERALALRPDIPEARVGVAAACLREGKLDKAREWLDFLDKPGAGQLYPLGPLERLALAYQDRQQHQDALALFSRLLEELPNIANHAGFRKHVRLSEKALGKSVSILPKAKFSLRRFFQSCGGARPSSVSAKQVLLILAVIAGLISIGLIISNEVIRRHRKLHIVNALGGKLKLEIAGRDPITIHSGLNEITLPEGHYRARISGATNEEVSFDIAANYFSRWGDKPAWVLNPGGAALLVHERAVYSRNSTPPQINFYYGKSFQAFSEITHPFLELPHSVRVDSAGGSKTLTSLALFRGQAVNALYALDALHRNPEACDLAEWNLVTHPDDKEMLRAYAGLAMTPADHQRCISFLRAGITNRPIHTEWHRMYQDLQRAPTAVQKLAEEYDHMLQTEPEDSTLLYLRGRVCDDHAPTTQFFERAYRADTNNPYPMFALAFDHAAAGDWPAAKSLLDRVMVLAPNDPQFIEIWKTSCLALEQYDTAASVLRRMFATNALDYRAAEYLCQIYAVQNNRDEAQKVMAALKRAVLARDSESAGMLQALVSGSYLYALGDFAELEKTTRADRSEMAKTFLFYALLEQNRLEEAGRIRSPRDLKDPDAILGASLACLLAGKRELAETWLAAVRTDFKSYGHEYAVAAAMFENNATVTQSDVEDLKLTTSLKAVIAANLALLHPELRAGLNATARRLNVERSFPYHLVRRATAP